MCVMGIVWTKLQRVEEVLRRCWDKDKYNARYKNLKKLDHLPLGVQQEYSYLGSIDIHMIESEIQLPLPLPPRLRLWPFHSVPFLPQPSHTSRMLSTLYRPRPNVDAIHQAIRSKGFWCMVKGTTEIALQCEYLGRWSEGCYCHQELLTKWAMEQDRQTG